MEAEDCNQRSDNSQKYILVTGGAGYIGSHATVELFNEGYNVVVVDNLCNSSIESVRRIEKITGKDIPFYKVDILEKHALQGVFKKYKFFAVMHFAGLKAVGESCLIPLAYYKNNIVGSLVLLEVMEEFAVTNIIFSSSATVYGDPEILPISESCPAGKCTNPYGWTKYMIEQIIRDVCVANKKFNAILLRYFNPVGSHKSGLIGEDPQGHPNNLTPFIAQVAVGRRSELKVFGNDYDTHDGTGVRDYIHVVDLAAGHVAALKAFRTNCGCKMYNLGTGIGYSVLDVVKAFERASKIKIPYSIVGRREGDVARMFADPSLAFEELHWKATRDIDEMCEDLWRWQSMNPYGFNDNNNNNNNNNNNKLCCSNGI
ncbi:hypothetical protein HELRODRAFT_157807 [Helobdella robusta]|uniref:UDP-glucose 4-epimerase n=1 Tax=Helobdella robusta TaxID=6412 RepID=T1EMG1_HELRO|nr:hypothetical protein HELRODRAFT_157807 [Helobdella robusta]ESN93712.1 hypothetical protein HELRODRAFT_157807 [Helobdella robusta]